MKPIHEFSCAVKFREWKLMGNKRSTLTLMVLNATFVFTDKPCSGGGSSRVHCFGFPLRGSNFSCTSPSRQNILISCKFLFGLHFIHNFMLRVCLWKQKIFNAAVDVPRIKRLRQGSCYKWAIRTKINYLINARKLHKMFLKVCFHFDWSRFRFQLKLLKASFRETSSTKLKLQNIRFCPFPIRHIIEQPGSPIKRQLPRCWFERLMWSRSSKTTTCADAPSGTEHCWSFHREFKFDLRV